MCKLKVGWSYKPHFESEGHGIFFFKKKLGGEN